MGTPKNDTDINTSSPDNIIKTPPVESLFKTPPTIPVIENNNAANPSPIIMSYPAEGSKAVPNEPKKMAKSAAAIPNNPPIKPSQKGRESVCDIFMN